MTAGGSSSTKTRAASPAAASSAKPGSSPVSVDTEHRASEKVKLSPEFLAFRQTYLTAFLCGCAADWLKGPYIYRLYEARGFQPSEITFLFAAGYTSSAIFGMCAGVMADVFGRRRMCLVFCCLYAVHGIMHISHSFAVLVAARTVSGVATALLFSAFEAWMVSEHHRRFSDVDLKVTFTVQTQGNALVAIVSGIVSQGLVHVGGYAAPFAGTLPVLGVCAWQVFTWPENVGKKSREALRHNQIGSTMSAVLSSMNSMVVRVGSLQCLFEGSMHIFVFLWTPALQRGGQTVPHGLIFTIFMVAFFLGGGGRLRIPLGAIFAIAALSLLVPCFCSNFWWNLIAFCIFEGCCGAYFPQIAVLRSKHFAESSRNATITLFRVPLNLIVVGTLLWGRSYPPEQLLAVASIALLLGAAVCMTFPSETSAHTQQNGDKKED